MKTDNRRKSKNIIVLKDDKAKRQYEAKNKMDVENSKNKTLLSNKRIKNQSDPKTNMGNLIKQSVRAAMPKAALEVSTSLKNLKDTAKPKKLEKSTKPKNKSKDKK